MPGFFKRKNRRHTADNPDETRAALRAAKKQISKKDIELKQGGGDELFLNHIKNKHPSKVKQAHLHVASDHDSISTTSSFMNGMIGNHTSSMPRSKSEMSNSSERGHHKMIRRNSAVSLNADILFLKWKGEVKRAPIPSPLSVTTLKSLFVCTFGVDVKVKEDPRWIVFVQDPDNEGWEPVSSIQTLQSRCLITIERCDNPPTPPPGQLTVKKTGRLSCSNPNFSGHTLSRRPSSRLLRHGPSSVSGSTLARIASGVQQGSTQTSSEDMSLATVSFDVIDVVNRVSSPEQRLIELEASILQEKLGQNWSSRPRSPADKSVRGRVTALKREVNSLQKDMRMMRTEQKNALNYFHHSFQQTADRILSTIHIHQNLVGNRGNISTQAAFRKQRIELVPEEEAYMKRSEKLYDDFKMLESWVEELRVDVAVRKCKVVADEVHILSDSVSTLARGLFELQKRHGPLVNGLREVMEKELEFFVKEERFVAEEEERLLSAIKKCESMAETLLNLRKVATVQHHRSPTLPVIIPDEEPDRQALLTSIESIIPDHAQRLESIKMTDEARRKKRDLLRPKGISVADQMLQAQAKVLKKTNHIAEVESRRQTRVKSMYIVEKLEKEQEEKKRMEEERKAEEEKRERERILEEQKRLDEQEKRRFEQECLFFEQRRRDRERRREELRRKEEEWRLKESQKLHIKNLSEKERLEEWRRQEHLRILEEQRSKQLPIQGDHRSNSRSSSENSNPGPHPPHSGGPPPYTVSSQPGAHPSNHLLHPSQLLSGGNPQHNGPALKFPGNSSQIQPIAPHRKYQSHHARSLSTDSKAKEQRDKPLENGFVTALQLESKGVNKTTTTTNNHTNNFYPWLAKGKKAESTTGSYYNEQQVGPKTDVRRRPSNPRKRNDPRRLSFGGESRSSALENGMSELSSSSAVRLAQSTDVSLMPTIPVKHQPHLNPAPPSNPTPNPTKINLKSNTVYSSFV
jgi:hypothetical protein